MKLSFSKKNIYYWLFLLFYCLLIFIQSSYPSPVKVPRLPYMDKVIHFAVYAILGILFFMAFNTLGFKKNIDKVIMLSILSSFLYGMTDEIHQYFVPYRDSDLMDFFADVTGSVCGVYLINSLNRNLKTQKQFVNNQK